MKKLFSLLLFSVFGFGFMSTYSQECTIYDGYKEGTTAKMVHYDKKDKVTGSSTTTVKERKDIPGGLALTFIQKYENTDDYQYESEFSVECVNGVVKVDMSKLLDPNSLAAYEDMEIEVEADDLSIPAKASAGDKLNDGNIKVTIHTGTPVNVSMTVSMTNRSVVSEEKVETPAGKFDCLKISYDLLSQIGFIKVRSSVTEYHNKKHGVIKTENYDKKGRLTDYSVLEEINY